MSSFDWERFLRRWSQEIIDAIDPEPEALPPEVRRSGWLGYPGATEPQIARAQARLGMSLPPSYQAFLKVTNGWRPTSVFSNKLWSLEAVEWFAVRHQAWIDAFWAKSEPSSSASANAKAPGPSIPDEDYFIYGDEQDCRKIRVEYLATALEISEQSDGAIYLLNPQIVTPDGEWETWFLGDWLPGADRYPSFQDMMQAEYESFLELREPPILSVAPGLKAEPQAARDRSPIEEAVVPSPIAASDSEALPIESSSPRVPATHEDWHDLASFAVEFQTRQGQEPREQRSTVHHLETDVVATRSDIDVTAIHRWMIEQLQKHADQAQPEKTVALEITQLRVIQPAQTETPMVVNQAQPLFTDTIQRGEPFALEVSLNVGGDDSPSLAEQPLVYRAQCVAHHLSDQLDTDLGDITTHVLGGNQSTYTTQFPEARLQQPGLYRLKVWVTLQNMTASPGYFKVPVLQVV